MTPMMTPTVIRWAFLFPMSMGPLCGIRPGARSGKGGGPAPDARVARCPPGGTSGHVRPAEQEPWGE